MAYPIKLKNEGESITIAVTACGLAPTGQYPEVLFTDGDTGEVYSVPQVSCDRQLTRLAMTYADCVGKIMTISRAHNSKDASKPFWNLDVVGKSDAVPPARPAVPSSPPAPVPAKPLDVARLKAEAQPFMQPEPPNEREATPDEQGRFHYAGITRWVLAEIVPMYAKAGITLDMVAIGAIVNTNAIREIR